MDHTPVRDNGLLAVALTISARLAYKASPVSFISEEDQHADLAHLRPLPREPFGC
jgi:hypothetical protein